MSNILKNRRVDILGSTYKYVMERALESGEEMAYRLEAGARYTGYSAFEGEEEKEDKAEVLHDVINTAFEMLDKNVHSVTIYKNTRPAVALVRIERKSFEILDETFLDLMGIYGFSDEVSRLN